MQFQVPQFIETEDKIVGPFSIRQFIYIGAAGIVSFFLYFTVELWLWVLGTVFSLALAMGFAFIKIEGRDLTHVLAAALNFYWKPQTYVWQPEHPEVPKSEALEKEAGISLEDVLSGAALRNAWRGLQTGTKVSPRQVLEKGEKYQIFQKLSGERRAARRIDYR
ncbi:MAG: PrgI family protein [Patescibacteria group bacterium]|mgnify:CR=1 FL=1